MGASPEEKMLSFHMADDYISKTYGGAEAVKKFRVTRHCERAETPLFKQNFRNWKETIVGDGATGATARKFKWDVSLTEQASIGPVTI